jgi:hypothetical protein
MTLSLKGKSTDVHAYRLNKSDDPLATERVQQQAP